ncbi:MAG: hypothetical protein M3O22_07240 [Pseudomonadota bacterium]|nr:hypothetical protein [Pseudomonadota bacterium]
MFLDNLMHGRHRQAFNRAALTSGLLITLGLVGGSVYTKDETTSRLLEAGSIVSIGTCIALAKRSGKPPQGPAP